MPFEKEVDDVVFPMKYPQFVGHLLGADNGDEDTAGKEA